MPRFSNSPPDQPNGPSLPLFRTPTGGCLIAVVTSDDLIGCPTHFFGGRTIPCDAPDCPACNKSVPWRWHGYVSALEVTRRIHFIFEMTGPASDSFVAYRAKFGTMRGCQFRASRMKRLPNSRVVIETKPADLAQVQLPQAPDLVLALCTIWSIPRDQVSAHRVINDRVRLHLHEVIPDDPSGRNINHKGPRESLASKPA